MKKNVLFAFFKIAFLFLLVSCSKSDDSNSNQPPVSTTEFIKLKCKGVGYNFTNPEILNSLTKSLVAFTPNEKRISIFVPLNVAVGTYSITDTPSNVNSYGISLAINAINLDSSATSGTITINSVTSNNVKGTFSCTIPGTPDAFVVTEGSFNVGN